MLQPSTNFGMINDCPSMSQLCKTIQKTMMLMTHFFGTLNHLHPRVGDAQPLTGCSATTGKRQRPHHQRGLAQEAPHPVTKSSARVGGVGVTRQAGIRRFLDRRDGRPFGLAHVPILCEECSTYVYVTSSVICSSRPSHVPVMVHAQTHVQHQHNAAVNTVKPRKSQAKLLDHSWQQAAGTTRHAE